jgi:hypothetical protein
MNTNGNPGRAATFTFGTHARNKNTSPHANMAMANNNMAINSGDDTGQNANTL